MCIDSEKLLLTWANDRRNGDQREYVYLHAL